MKRRSYITAMLSAIGYAKAGRTQQANQSPIVLYCDLSVDASREQETRYIDEIRKQYYAPLAQMSVPLSEQNFITYGASTTPTLVLIDRQGIVRLYHPGTMPYAQLAAQVAQITGN